MTTLPTIPGYELKSRLGAGGMGVVYSATRADNDYQYAIKMLLTGRGAAIADLARFRVEAEAYACLNHPSIIKIRDVGVASGCPFLAMDLAENGSLDTFIAKHPSLDVNWRVETIRNVAQALSHAHGRRILHRDLKPANILIMGDHSPRVADFGLVKFAAPMSAVSASCCTFSVGDLDQHLLQIVNENRNLLLADESPDNESVVETLIAKCAERSGFSTAAFDVESVQSFVEQATTGPTYSREISPLVEAMTRDGSVLGSPQYMSPEQAEGRLDGIGPHTDVYGLGATLYRVVTGAPPFSGSSLLKLMAEVCTVNPPFPSELNAEVPEELDLIIMKALQKKPEHRYANMQMFADDLLRFLDGRPPLAKLSAPSRQNQSPAPKGLRRIAKLVSTLLQSTVIKPHD